MAGPSADRIYLTDAGLETDLIFITTRSYRPLPRSPCWTTRPDGRCCGTDVRHVAAIAELLP